MLMALVFLSVIVLCTLSAAVALFVEPNPATAMGRLSIFLQETLPERALAFIVLLPGGRACHSCCVGVVDRLCNKPNPVLQSLYLLLILGGFGVYLMLGAPLVPNPRLGWIHSVVPFFAVNTTLITFMLASFSPPGFVTKRNQFALKRIYPYDGFLFVKRTCESCGCERVARSKHCRVVDRCVEKYDHFCPWINNAVGARNYRFFLLFVFCTTLLLTYASYVVTNILVYIVEKERLWYVVFVHAGSNLKSQGDWRVILQYMMSSWGLLLFLWIMASVMGLTLWGFLFYHIYLISCGTTTNENSKWGGVRDYYKAVLSKRKKFPEPERESALLSPNMPPISSRDPKDFPREVPRNIYNADGLFANLRPVLFPPPVVILPQDAEALAAAEQEALVASEAVTASSKTKTE